MGLLTGICIFIPLPSVGFYLPKLTILAVTSALCLPLIIIDKKRCFSFSGQSVPGLFFAGFILCVFLSPFWSLAPVISITGLEPRFDGLLAFFVYLGLFIGFFHLATSNNAWLKTVSIFILPGTILACHGFLQLINADPLNRFFDSEAMLGRVFSLVGQPNTLGQILLITLPFQILLSTRLKKIKKILMLALAIISVIVLLATVSRASLLGLLFIIILGAGLLIFRNNNLSALKKWIMPLVLVLAGITFIAVGLFNNRFQQSFQSNRSINARQVIAGVTFNLIKERWYGYGPETLGIVSPRETPKRFYEYESLTTEIDRTHSKPLQLLYDYGIQGLVFYYCFLFALLFSLWKKRQNPVCLTCFLAMAGISLNLLFDFETVPSHTLFWVLAGLSFGSLAVKKPILKFCQPLLILLPVTVLTFLSSYLSVQWFISRLEMNKAETYFSVYDLENSFQEYKTAVNRFPFDRQSLINAAETGLYYLEEPAGQYSVILENTKNWLIQLHYITNGEDGLAYALQAWLRAVELTSSQPFKEKIEELFSTALYLKPASIPIQRIRHHVYGLINDTDKQAAASADLKNLLPSGWSDETAERHRILKKEHPWLYELLE